MRSQLMIIHRSLAGGLLNPFEGEAVWSTCLRSIALASREDFASQIQPTDDQFEGHAAYLFLLETVCGLNSPVKGETEVHGQYKKFLDKVKPLLPRETYKALLQVHIDAKFVRTTCLRNLGSQSYGSYCRRQVKGLSAINLIGSGHLARELMPWLAKSEAAVQLFCRAAQSKQPQINSRFRNVKVAELFDQSAQLSGAIIIAAPVKSQDLAGWLKTAGQKLQLVIDLRAESAHDPLPAPGNGIVISLKNVFEAIESARAKINTEVEIAQRLIKEIVYANAQNISAQKRSRSFAGLSDRSSA